MLLNSFFTPFNLPQSIEEINKEKHVAFTVGVKVNPKNKIFEGHFPGKPIIPGVTYIEMIREIMSIVLRNELRLKTVSNIKFLSVTNPEIIDELNFAFNLILKEDNLISTKVLISSQNGNVIKFDGNFQFQDTF
jgi:3-hydroxyacyl-[acyl-carrier-protein] dehydratase